MCQGALVTWEQQLLDLFDDLEQRAEGLALAERDAEVAELARGEYAAVDLAARLHASVGLTVELRLNAVGLVRGRLARVGVGWCLLVRDVGAGRAEEWVLVTTALLGARGLAAGALAEQARPVTARLGLASALRRLAGERAELVCVTRDGERRSGIATRVGADFLELASPEAGFEVLPYAGLVALRAR